MPQPVWTTPFTLGDGSNSQGGNPPALALEPAAIDEAGRYNRNDWISNNGITRIDQGEAKFRLTANFAFFATVDPILYPGKVMNSHHHTFFGNLGLFEAEGRLGVSNATYEKLRTYPKSTATGGPLNATLYWEPTLFFEATPDLHFPIKPQVITFYYTNGYEEVDQLFRLLRGLAFIGGVDPNDRLNLARKAELPSGWTDENDQLYGRLNGWVGWTFVDLDTGETIPLAEGNTADSYGPGSAVARQLVNADGSDPWGGAAENPNAVLIATLLAPPAWNGTDLRHKNGRDHFRYFAHNGNTGEGRISPDHWWKIPHFEGKTEYPASRPGFAGHEYRRRLYLSSDRWGRAEPDWHPRGSTMHFDWMNGWDSQIQHTWHSECNGITQDGVPGNPLTCGNSTISATQRMLVREASPDPTLSQDPIITFHNYRNGPSRNVFGNLPVGTRISGIIGS